MAIDVHQHLWPDELVDCLRARTRPPYLRGWTLHTDGEPPFEVDPTSHDPGSRVLIDHEDGVTTACVSLSAPLGIEALPRRDAAPLIAAYHRGVAGLPQHFRAWASVPTHEPDLADLRRLLGDPRFVGLQVPATQLLTPVAWERLGPVLTVAQDSNRPVLVHPGPVPRVVGEAPVPSWFPAVVGYTAQLSAAWWAWHAVAGRDLFPRLRLVFAAAAGLGPVHHERQVLRGGEHRQVDPDVYVDTSGYGPRALDAVVRELGIDALVLGSDRPYASPLPELFGEAATHAIRETNPVRLLVGPAQEGDLAWPSAS